MKKCGKCKKEKTEDCFYKCLSTRDGLQTTCKECKKQFLSQNKEYRLEYARKYRKLNPEKGKELMREWRKKNIEKARERSRKYMKRIRLENPDKVRLYDRKLALKKKYGITISEYNNILKKQRGLCAICKKKEINLLKRLCVDHCHVTKKVRGLLCRECNVALGLVKDKIQVLKSMIKYLSN